MSAHLSQEQIKRLCEDLVYQVGYAFYDAPYIILLNLMVHFEVAKESDLTEATFVQATEIRKYMGMLLTHRLIKRHANKERVPIPEYLLKKNDTERTRLKEVIYYYLDYREFANVVKYRIAMMRKGIDEKIMNDVGHKGYVCPSCSRMYTPLQIPTLFVPAHNAFMCEDDNTELIEHVPDETDSSDKMQRFNRATQPIRDALRAVEGITLPTVNILAWVAEHVKSTVVLAEGDEASNAAKVQVVLGGEGEREQIERERLAEQQRVQNALPIWHTHSTVTGSATTLGIADKHKAAALAAERKGGKSGKQGENDDAMLMKHYETMIDATEDVDDDFQPETVVVKMEVKEERIDRDHEDEEDEDEPSPPAAILPEVAIAPGGSVSSSKMVNVNGVPKALDDITEEDQEEMTPDEYQAYYDAATA